MIRKEALRFLISGAANTLASWLVYLALTAVVPYTVAYTAAYAFGVVLTYYLNSRWVFKVPMSWRSFLQYPSVYVVQYGLGILLVWLLVENWPATKPYAPLVVVVATLPVTFLMSRFILKRGAA